MVQQKISLKKTFIFEFHCVSLSPAISKTLAKRLGWFEQEMLRILSAKVFQILDVAK